MKSFLLLCVLFTSNLFASTIDSHSLPIFALENEENFSLNTVVTKTLYRTESRANTCYRTEFDGYYSHCDFFPVVQCYEHDRGHRDCHTTMIYSCRNEPRYRTVPYTCYDSVSVPYEVTDHSATANFHINVNKSGAKNTDARDCFLHYTMDGESVRANAECSNVLVLSSSTKTNQVDRAGNVTFNYEINLTLLDKNTSIAPVANGINAMNMEGHTLTFRVGDLSKNPNFSLNLFVERRHLLKSDETLINRPLTATEFSFEKINEQEGVIKVNFDRLLSGFNDQKKHVIKVDLNVQLPYGNVLNTTLPALSAHGELTVKK
jgi:hypothetical protein